jgi:polar amino acid transport system substrate-binding protein
MEMLAGGADAVVADNGVVEVYAKNNPNEKLKVIEDSDSFEAEYYGILFPKGTDLQADFNKAIKKIVENGTYEKIYQEWFGQEPNIEMLKAEQEASE